VRDGWEGYMWRWLVVKVEVKIVWYSNYKFRLGPGRVLPSSPVPELSLYYQNINTSYQIILVVEV
jgi:hypothetical protein